MATKTSSVTTAVERDLKLLATRSEVIASSGLAAAARVLAKELDSSRNSATSKSMCARALRETLDRLFELAPAAEKGDHLDDLSRRRAARVGGSTA